MSEPAPRPPTHPIHGQPTFLQIPGVDVIQSAGFYETIFGWRVERPYPSFEAPGMIGQWVTDRPAAADAGPVIWIAVDRLDKTLDLVEANGGTTVQPPTADDERWLATIRDPAGNLIGLVQLGSTGK